MPSLLGLVFAYILQLSISSKIRLRGREPHSPRWYFRHPTLNYWLTWKYKVPLYRPNSGQFSRVNLDPVLPVVLTKAAIRTMEQFDFSFSPLIFHFFLSTGISLQGTRYQTFHVKVSFVRRLTCYNDLLSQVDYHISDYLSLIITIISDNRQGLIICHPISEGCYGYLQLFLTINFHNS